MCGWVFLSSKFRNMGSWWDILEVMYHSIDKEIEILTLSRDGNVVERGNTNS